MLMQARSTSTTMPVTAYGAVRRLVVDSALEGVTQEAPLEHQTMVWPEEPYNQRLSTLRSHSQLTPVYAVYLPLPYVSQAGLRQFHEINWFFAHFEF